MGIPAAFFFCKPKSLRLVSPGLPTANATTTAKMFFSKDGTRSLPTAGWWSRCHAPQWVSYKRPATPPTWHSPPTAGGVGRVLYFYRARVPGLKQLGSDRVVI